MKMRLIGLLVVTVLLNGCNAQPVEPVEEVAPIWADQGPRILFNVLDTSEVAEVVPDRFHLSYWHGGPTTSIVFSQLAAGSKGHLLGGKSIHGEEYVYLHKGRLNFILDEYRENIVVDEGQFMRWPNIAHWGTCMTETCEIYAFFTPSRDDYGSEGSTMTETSNTWISRRQGK